jgi:hypothetical protein
LPTAYSSCLVASFTHNPCCCTSQPMFQPGSPPVLHINPLHQAARTPTHPCYARHQLLRIRLCWVPPSEQLQGAHAPEATQVGRRPASVTHKLQPVGSCSTDDAGSQGKTSKGQTRWFSML